MLKVMSFNIRYGLAADGDNHWQHRKALTAARLQEFAPDLLGIQECRDDEQADFVKNNLPAYQFYGVHREGSGETALEMAPLLTRTAEFEVLEKGHFWLSKTPDIAGSKNWDSVFPRTCTWVKLLHRASGKSLLFLNTHFDYQPIAIVESAKMLQQWIKQTVQDTPLIVTGDFNTEKNSPAFQLLAESGLLVDAHQNLPKNTGTFHEFGTLTKLETIDWILVSQHFKVVNAAVDTYHEGSLYPSDHYPITAVLDWKN